MKILSLPHSSDFSEESGIKQVCLGYEQYLPEFEIELVSKKSGSSYELVAAHAGIDNGSCDISHLHGIYFTEDYPAPAWEYKSNQRIVNSIRHAKQITVPSSWVAEIFQRDFRINPHVIPHGIDVSLWKHNHELGNYVIGYAKNRAGQDVCNPAFLSSLAKRFPNIPFMATFAYNDCPNNVKVTGPLPHSEMKSLVQRGLVFINTTKETWGIAMAEALAAGTPVLAYKHGGAIDLVQHGVNGYLADPNNIDDLANGLAYCLKYRNTLSNNAKYIASHFMGWRPVAKKVAEIYKLAAIKEEPTVSIVIPCYNYGAVLERAVNSALEQTRPVNEVIIVDDGSTDDSADIAQRLEIKHPTVRYIHQDNAGVANARNTGVRAATSKYIVCLDSDDKLDSRFVEACVPELENDRSLGIAYTGLQYIKPDGSTGLSPWPAEFNYDDQLQGKNQIPTCCMFRKEMWSRLGGYRQRYAPAGAGEEDAEFWLRSGAYGWNAKKVTNAGLFIYSWQSGRVSGNRQHKVTNYRAWHPWVQDGKHPIASLSSPTKMSHAVRQYDEPSVSVIIPVGPGHQGFLIDALDSLEAQTFRHWEAIVVNDGYENGIDKDILTAYPYIRLFDTSIGQGAGVARNIGVDNSRADFILFLDADDWLHPLCLERMIEAWSSTGHAVYTDYVGVSIVEDTSRLAKNLQSNIIEYDEKRKRAVIRYKAAEYDCDKAASMPSSKPYIWNNITTLIPKLWHYEIGGFDESMLSWEDVDYWWRMSWEGKCFVRVDEPLMVYRFNTGGRRQKGLDNWDSLLTYLRDKKERGGETMGCSGCGNKKRYSSGAKTSNSVLSVAHQGNNENMNDNEFQMIQYNHANRGQHIVVGGATKRKYGYRRRGDRFLVHISDIQVQPSIFVVVDMKPKTVVKLEPEPTPEPKLINEPESIVPEVETMETTPINNAIKQSISLDLQTIPGVTPNIAKQMTAAQITSIESILNAGVSGLKKLKYVGDSRAKSIYNYINERYGNGGDGDN